MEVLPVTQSRMLLYLIVVWIFKITGSHATFQWFTAFSLPGQFAPRSESANRSLANSLPGTFAPWPFRSLALSLLGLLAPWNFRSLERNGPGTFVPWNFRAQEYSLPGTFAPWNFRSLLVRAIICDIRSYCNDMTFMWYVQACKGTVTMAADIHIFS